MTDSPALHYDPSSKTCPVCAAFEHTDIDSQDYGEWLAVNCPRCHRFRISLTAIAHLNSRYSDSKPRLSAWIRDRDETDRPPPSISAKDLPTICDALPTLRVVDKQRILLEVIERKTVNPGSRVGLFYDHDYPLAWAADRDELEYLLDSLQARGHLALIGRQSDRIVETCQVTPSGWEYLDRLDRRAVDTDQVFIAMWFDQSMHAAWTDAIRPTIQNLGYRPYRVDNDPSNAQRVDAKIQLEIGRSASSSPMSPANARASILKPATPSACKSQSSGAYEPLTSNTSISTRASFPISCGTTSPISPNSLNPLLSPDSSAQPT